MVDDISKRQTNVARHFLQAPKISRDNVHIFSYVCMGDISRYPYFFSNGGKHISTQVVFQKAIDIAQTRKLRRKIMDRIRKKSVLFFIFGAKNCSTFVISY